ncbi:MAG: serine O-acetyltransferase [Oscillospiraceae bacterium]|nr:serine O-acetyltransferase [Oscillospiraceae bacterium]
MNDNDLNYLVKSITTSYAEDVATEDSCLDGLPSRTEVETLNTILRRLLFPGYFDDAVINSPDTEWRVRDLLIAAEQRLRRQIALSLCLDTCGELCEKSYNKAGEICRDFLSKLPAVRKVLLTDAQATYDGDPAAKSVHEVIFAYPGIFAITVYRLAHELYKLEVPFIPRMMSEHAHSLTGIEINPGAVIGGHFFIDHGTGVVIGETAVIGSHVKLYQGVTLGALSTRGGQRLRGQKRHPTLEDEVTVYSGATILGGDTVIGRGSVIGGNAFVIESVPENTSVSMKKPELDFKLRPVARKE